MRKERVEGREKEKPWWRGKRDRTRAWEYTGGTKRIVPRCGCEGGRTDPETYKRAIHPPSFHVRVVGACTIRRIHVECNEPCRWKDRPQIVSCRVHKRILWLRDVHFVPLHHLLPPFLCYVPALATRRGDPLRTFVFEAADPASTSSKERTTNQANTSGANKTKKRGVPVVRESVRSCPPSPRTCRKRSSTVDLHDKKGDSTETNDRLLETRGKCDSPAKQREGWIPHEGASK